MDLWEGTFADFEEGDIGGGDDDGFDGGAEELAVRALDEDFFDVFRVFPGVEGED